MEVGGAGEATEDTVEREDDFAAESAVAKSDVMAFSLRAGCSGGLRKTATDPTGTVSDLKSSWAAEFAVLFCVLLLLLA